MLCFCLIMPTEAPKYYLRGFLITDLRTDSAERGSVAHKRILKGERYSVEIADEKPVCKILNCIIPSV